LSSLILYFYGNSFLAFALGRLNPASGGRCSIPRATGISYHYKLFQQDLPSFKRRLPLLQECLDTLLGILGEEEVETTADAENLPRIKSSNMYQKGNYQIRKK